MAKTAKYEMYINTYNTLGNIIPLSKKSFTETLDNYKKQIDKNIKECNEYRKNHPECADRDENDLDEINVTVKEYEKYTETLYCIHDNMTSICLRKLECKDGYHWK